MTRPLPGQANGPLMEKFLAAMIDAEAWMKANPDEAITTMAKAVGIKREDLAPIWSDYVYRVRSTIVCSKC